MGAAQGGRLVLNLQLIQSLILLLLAADVLADNGFIPPYGRHEVPSGPEMLPDSPSARRGAEAPHPNVVSVARTAFASDTSE